MRHLWVQCRMELRRRVTLITESDRILSELLRPHAGLARLPCASRPTEPASLTYLALQQTQDQRSRSAWRSDRPGEPHDRRYLSYPDCLSGNRPRAQAQPARAFL